MAIADAAPGSSGSAGSSNSDRDDAPVVVKLGGEVLDARWLSLVASDLRQAFPAARSPVVIHGGGPQVTALSGRLGLAPHIIAGRRVTDAATLDVVKMVVAGLLNVDLVAALRGAGVPAVGLTGVSGVVRARRRPKRVVSGGGPDPIDFGFVGDVDSVDVGLLTALCDLRRWPVIACLAATDGGEVLNINADVVATRVAAELRAAALVVVTGVGGVRENKDDPKTRIARLTVAEARAAIVSGRVQGGMIPKLEEAFEPLAAGVGAVHIVAPGEVRAAIESPGRTGTVLVP